MAYTYARPILILMLLISSCAWGLASDVADVDDSSDQVGVKQITPARSSPSSQVSLKQFEHVLAVSENIPEAAFRYLSKVPPKTAMAWLNTLDGRLSLSSLANIRKVLNHEGQRKISSTDELSQVFERLDLPKTLQVACFKRGPSTWGESPYNDGYADGHNAGCWKGLALGAIGGLGTAGLIDLLIHLFY